MNFLFVVFSLFSLTFFLFSCGVKNDPLNPNNNAYPSVLDEINKKIKQNYYDDAEFDSSSR